MKREKITPVFLLLLIASVLMISNGALVASNKAPIMLSSSPPIIVRFSNWANFTSEATNASAVSLLHEEPSTTVLVEAEKQFNNSANETEDRILTYDGDFVGNQTVRSNPTLLDEWLAGELSVQPYVVKDNTVLSVSTITSQPFWGRITFGIPGFVEGGLAYVWLFFAVLVLLATIFIFFNPRGQKRFGLWIVVFSLLTLPVGGGFILGAVLGAIAGILGLEWPKSFGDTFIGRIVHAATFNGKTLGTLATDAGRMQTAVLTVILVAVLSSFGVTLYVFNVNMIYASEPFQALTSTYSIFVQGATFIGMDVYFAVAAYITVGIVKWLVLSIIVYLVGSKVLGYEFKFSGMATALAFVYVPEILQMFTPTLFTNEPLLSQGTIVDFIPTTWPLILFYISRIWAFVILVIVVKKIMDLSTLRALGFGLLTGTAYLVLNYVYVYPTLNLPGLKIQFSTGSSMPILIVMSIVVVIAFLLGTFKKQA